MITILVPVYNEEESLQLFYDEVLQEITKITKSYEIVFVDDGSTDTSLQIIKHIADGNKNVRIFSFRRNRGKAEALTFGFQRALGDYIVTLDADLQDSPSEIEKLLEKTKEGWEVICGWREERRDNRKKIISSKIFNFLVGIFWGLHLHDLNCGLKVYTKEAAQSLQLYGGLHRFIPVLAFQQGFRITEVPVLHSVRKLGKSKYGFSKLWKDLPDIFTMLFLTRYGNRPLHFFGSIGSVFIFIGLVIFAYLSVIHFQGHPISDRPILFFGIVFVLGGLQILFTGFLADLLINLSLNKGTEIPLRFEKN